MHKVRDPRICPIKTVVILRLDGWVLGRTTLQRRWSRSRAVAGERIWTRQATTKRPACWRRSQRMSWPTDMAAQFNRDAPHDTGIFSRFGWLKVCSLGGGFTPSATTSLCHAPAGFDLPAKEWLPPSLFVTRAAGTGSDGAKPCAGLGIMTPNATAWHLSGPDPGAEVGGCRRSCHRCALQMLRMSAASAWKS